MKMKLGIILVLLTSTAFARIGETPEQCKTRYGEPVLTPKDGNIVFEKGPLGFVLSFYEGKCASILLQKKETDIIGNPLELSATEIEVLLTANGGSRKWKEASASLGTTRWITDDGTIQAQYDLVKHGLCIYTTAALKRQQAADAEKEKASLSGF